MDGLIRFWKCRKAILHDVRAQDLLPSLRADLVITLEEEEIIMHEITTKARTEKLFWFLFEKLEKSEDYERFHACLQDSYPHIATMLDQALVTEEDETDCKEAVLKQGLLSVPSSKYDVPDSPGLYMW